jgi:hypothetical protein
MWDLPTPRNHDPKKTKGDKGEDLNGTFPVGFVSTLRAGGCWTTLMMGCGCFCWVMIKGVVTNRQRLELALQFRGTVVECISTYSTAVSIVSAADQSVHIVIGVRGLTAMWEGTGGA